MKVVEQPNGYMYVEYKDANDDRKFKSLHTKDRSLANKMIKDARVEDIENMVKYRIDPEQIIRSLTFTDKTIGEALDEWEEVYEMRGASDGTVLRNKAVVESLLTFNDLGLDIGCSQLKMRHIHEYINAKDNRSKSTRERNLSAINVFMKFLNNQGYIRGNPAGEVRVTNKNLTHKQIHPRSFEPFTDEEIEIMMSVRKEELVPSLQFFYYAIRIAHATGLRIGDVCQLEWDCVDIEKSELIVYTEKRETQVVLPIDEEWTPGLRKALIDIELTGTPYLFPIQREVSINHKIRSRHSTYFKRFLDYCGIEGKSFHSFRHYRFSKWKQKIKSIKDLKGFTGHKSASSVAIYTNHKV